MNIKDLLQETKTSLLSNLTRTGLTILGIVIGIASVIIMLAIGSGAQESITTTINNLGTNVLSVQPGGGARPGQVSGDTKPLRIEDAEDIKKLANVKDIAPLVFTRQQVVAGDKNINEQIYLCIPGTQSNHQRC
jgi:putative ABC transport system permease protein